MSVKARHGAALLAVVALAVGLVPLAPAARAQAPDPGLSRVLGNAEIRVLGLTVDLDTRPDVPGVQSTMTAVKDVPTGALAVVGALGVAAGNLPAGARVRAGLSGPALGAATVTLTALPNQLMEIPPLGAPGVHRLSDVRLEDAAGNVLLRRDPALAPITIDVIDELLVTQVTSRPLSLEEIEDKGIVIDEDNFTALNFTVGLTLGSEQVVIDLPVAIPNTQQAALELEAPSFASLPAVRSQLDRINIPNFSIAGFQLRAPPEVEARRIQIPPISGVVVIPGNIAFLNQFFSVVVQATNVAPAGSGLVLENARAVIALPPGDDEILDSGDDPLRIAETASAGVRSDLPLTDAAGDDRIGPQATNDAEFLVEGLREGTHTVTFDIGGDLFVPALGESVALSGTAAGVVQVKNPTFSMVLAHPDVVRDGEAYSLFVTVTNTSTVPANLFQLALNSRSLSGTRLADGERERRTLESLAPGDAQTFEYRLVARTTGEVTGTVFLADEGINGSFVLNTGVGDTGIPLSPDTLVLPQTVDFLPDDPDLVFAAVRVLGQAYSVATAPAGALPPEIARVSRGFVFERAVKVAQAGLHVRFGETPLRAAQDILMDWLGSDLARLDTLFDSDPQGAERARRDWLAFDGLRRAADAGHDFSDTVAAFLGNRLDGAGVGELQGAWAGTFASRPAHLSFGASSRGPPVALELVDPAGGRLGRAAPEDPVSRGLPSGARLALTDADELLLVAAPGDAYEAAFAIDAPGEIALSLVVPDGDGMAHAVYPAVDLPAGARGTLAWIRDGMNDLAFAVDTDGDGSADLTLAPERLEPVVDRPPRVLGVHQWGRGERPQTVPSFDSGDPIGRMLGVLFSEQVDAVGASAAARYALPGNTTRAVALQPDARIAFVVVERPVGPFVARELAVDGIADVRGNVMAASASPIAADPDRGTGGTFSGRVVAPDGRAVPFARVKYLQPLSFPSLFDACFGDRGVRDFVITTVTADADGRFALDYVARVDFPAGCPTNPDIWLNRNNARGTSNFKLEAVDPVTGDVGRASSRIEFDGQRASFDVIIRGFGAIQGTVYDEAGARVGGGPPGSGAELAVIATNTSTGEVLQSWVDEQGGYAFPRAFVDASGAEVDVPRPAVGNVILQIVRAADGLTAVATVNIPRAGATVVQDLIMVPSTRYGTVTGRVLEADGVTGAANVPVQITGQVLAGVSAFSRSFATAVVGATVTDDEGAFRFDRVPSGDVALRALRQSTFEQADAASFLDEGETEDVVLVFPGSGGTVEGVVRDALGNPVADAVVGAGPAVTRSDAAGFFRLAGLPVGSFTVFAQGPGSPALGIERVDALGPSEVQSVVITLEAVGSIRGTVREADGVTPVAGQRLQLWVGNDGVMAETVTDDSGGYRFDDYPVQSYTVRAVRADRGDGGQAFTAIRFAGDRRDADVTFRGLGRIEGRVVQSNGTPALTDVIVTRKVWRVIPDQASAVPNPYLDFIKEIAGLDDDLGARIDGVLRENGLDRPPPVFFMLLDESALIASDGRGPNGEVTGEFLFDGPATGGPFTVAAFGPFLTPAEVTGAIPATTDPAARTVDVGDIVLEPAVGRVTGTVLMPDGVTPAGENVRVTIRSLDSAGSVQTAGGSVSQPVLPAYDVVTGPDGRFEFPLVLRGGFVLGADTGAPDPAIRAGDAASMQTERFADDAGQRLLNVRLYGRAGGVVPRGGTLDVAVRLRDVAGVDVQVVRNDGVTPVPFAEVTLSTASSLDADDEAGFARQVADADGRIAFFPVIEGDFSVSARDPDSPARGTASGTVPENPPDGSVRAVTVTLGAVTTASGQVQPAQVFGTVEGTVLGAGGEPLANPAEVRVGSAGVEVLATSGADGRFRAENVPGGFFTVDAFEPFTARRGSAGGRIRSDGEVVDVAVTLVGLGTVTGEVLDHDGTQMLVAVDVVLMPSGNFTDRIVSRTGADGRYRLPGVPLGPYTVKATDPASGLTGEAADRMRADGDTNTTDVFLEASARITGTLYAPGTRLDAAGVPVDGAGVPLADPPVVAGASVTLDGAAFSQRVQTGADGRFESGAFLRLGAYALTARPAAGADGAAAATSLDFHGQVRDVALVLRGTGAVEGQVLDAVSGAPEPSARVTLFAASPFSPGPATRFTDADGRFRFDGVPVGDYSLSVETTLRTPELGASVTGTLAAHGALDAWLDGDADAARDAIRLDDTGTVLGRVLLPDAAAPAAGAIVELRGAGVVLSRIADAAGVFRFAGLPLASYAVRVLEPASDGVARRDATVGANGETVDLGDIAVDAEPPTVTATVPAANAADVFPTDPVSVTFGEPIDPASVTASTLRVRVDGADVPGARQLSADGLTATFFPEQPLPDRRRVTVTVAGERRGFEGQVIAPGVTDRAGLGMLADVVFDYTTADTTPPALVGVSPPDGAGGVALASVVRVEFSEPLDAATVDAFTLSAGGVAVAGTVNAQPVLGGRVLVFTPAAPLLPDTVYRVDVDGALADRSGNMLAGGVHTTFRTLDTLAPVIASLSVPAGAPRVFGAVLPVSAGVDDDAARVDFYVNGSLLASDDAAPFAASVALTESLGTAVTVSAVAEDAAGNRSAPTALTLSVTANAPPSVSILSPTGGTVAQGGAVTLLVSGSDDVGVARLSFTADDGASGSGSRSFGGAATSVQHAFAVPVPAGLAPGARLRLRAAATDGAGQVATSGEVVLTVIDTAGPSVAIGSPAPGALVEPGDTVSVFVRADDPSGVVSLGLVASGLSDAMLERSVVPATTTASAAFQLPIPIGALPTDTLMLVARATDAAGNTGMTGLVVGVRDRLPPSVSLDGVPMVLDVAPGQSVVVRVRASDSIGVERIELAVDGAAQPAYDAMGATDASAPFSVAVPATQPFGSELLLETAAEDTSGNRASGPAVLLRVRDLEAPAVAFDAPPAGAEVVPGDSVTVALSATDNDRVASLRLIASGAAALDEPRAVDPPAASATAAFTLPVPADAAPGAAITLRATATDASGRDSTIATRTLTVADRVAPRVLSVSPADGAAGVAADAAVELRFDEALEAASVTPASVRIERADGTAVAAARALAAGGTRIVLTPQADLALGAEHVISVSTEVTDVAGNALATPFQSRFTTENPDVTGPRLVSLVPADGAAGVGVRPGVTASFDEPLARSPAALVSLTLLDAGGTAVAATVTHADGDRALRLVPDAPLAFGAAYTAVLSAGAADAAGNPVTDASGAALVELRHDFTTTGFGIVRPAAGAAFAEGESIAVEAVVASAGIARVEFRADGVAFASDTAGPFTASLTAPAPGASGVLTLAAVALAGDGSVLASDAVTVSLFPAMAFERRLAGVPLDETVELALRFSSPAAGDLTIGVVAGDPLVAVVPDVLVLPQGDTVLAVPVLGALEGATTLTASGPVRDAHAVVAVAPRPADQAFAVQAPSAGVHVPSVRRSSLPLRVPSAGTYALHLPLLDAPAADAVTLPLASANPAVLAVPAEVSVPAGAIAATVTIDALAAGDAALRVRRGDAVVSIPVVVGPAPAGAPRLAAAAVGVNVQDPLPLRALQLAAPGTVTVHVPLPSEAAVARTFALASSDETVLRTAPDAVVPAGARVVAVALDGVSDGRATLRLRSGELVIAMTVTVGGAPARTGVQSAGAGFAVLPDAAGGAVALAGVGAHPLVVTLLAEPAPADRVVTVTSSDPAVLAVPAAVTLPAGARAVRVDVDALADGDAVVRLDLLDGSVLLPIRVGAGAAPGRVAAQPVGVAVRAAGAAGTVYADRSPGFDLMLPLLRAPAAEDVRVDLFSRDPSVADVLAASATIAAGETAVAVPLIVTGADGSTALIELQLDGRTYVLRVIVGVPLPGDVPVTVAPTVGVEVGAPPADNLTD